jgi:CDP-diacylglycerol--inositol 3-phosphatidyltransferase
MNPVFLWAPNLIGYGRIVSAALAFYFANQPLIGASLYVSSQLLDSVDGHVARALGQSSRFGAVLDMLTDRMSSMVLMLLLGKFYPEFDFCFTWLVVLDVVAHWCQMYR